MKNDYNTKKEIEEDLYLYVCISDIVSGSLQEVADKILSLECRLRTEHEEVRQNPDKYIRFNIRLETNHYDGDYDADIKLSGIRLETDLEFNSRIKRHERAVKAQKESAKKRAENIHKKDLETLKRLAKKYKIVL